MIKLLEEIDELLAYLEDTPHGEEGNRITEMRYKILTELSNSHKHGVMQAEGSDEHICKYCGVLTSQPDEDCYKNPNRAKVAAVGQRSVGTSGSAGCVHNTLEYIGPWYSCKTCGTHFNARAEAPSEGACDF